MSTLGSPYWKKRLVGLTAALLFAHVAYAAPQQPADPPPGQTPELNVPEPELVQAMNRYREFVATPEEMVQMKSLSLKVKQWLYVQEDGEVEEKLAEQYDLRILVTNTFATWRIRMESKSQGQELVLVGSPNGQNGFGMLGGVVQGHPVYNRHAGDIAFFWSNFFLRWLNPDLPLFHADYQNRHDEKGEPTVDRVLLNLKPDGKRITAAWRLSIDVTTGAPVYLETFDPANFQLKNRMKYVSFVELGSLRFPERCEFYNAKGVKISAYEFSEFRLNDDVDPKLYQSPAE